MIKTEIVPFETAHVAAMQIQPAQWIPPDEQAEALATPGMAYTLLVDGHPVACGGVAELWHGRGYAWALLGVDCGPWFVHIHRAMKRGLVACGMRRVEMAVDAQFGPGQRWAEMLGFTLETPEPMRSFLPNGRDAYLYAKVQ